MLNDIDSENLVSYVTKKNNANATKVPSQPSCTTTIRRYSHILVTNEKLWLNMSDVRGFNYVPNHKRNGTKG